MPIIRKWRNHTSCVLYVAKFVGLDYNWKYSITISTTLITHVYLFIYVLFIEGKPISVDNPLLLLSRRVLFKNHSHKQYQK